jgi:hypothetical protein
VLLPAIGLPGAMDVGALLNILVALIAFALARGSEPTRPPSSSARVRRWTDALLLPNAASSPARRRSPTRSLGAHADLVFGSTVHAFEIMLAAFIGGLACGSLWIRGASTITLAMRVGGIVQIGMGIAALVSLVLYDHSFDVVPGHAFIAADPAATRCSMQAPRLARSQSWRPPRFSPA